jgi:PAS domain S-box-containing protein
MERTPLDATFTAMRTRMDELAQKCSGQPAEKAGDVSKIIDELGTILAELQEERDDLHLREQNLERLASFPELNPNPVIEVDLTGQVYYQNPAAKRLFPDLHEAGLNHPWLEGLQKLGEAIERAQVPFHLREVGVGDFWYQQACHLLEDGKRLRIYGVDITDGKKKEVELHKTSRRLRGIMESISDGFFALDKEMTVTYFNPAASSLLCRSKGEVLGRKLFDAFPEARGSIFEEKYTRALKEGKFTTFETYFGVKPYENWYDVRVYPFEDGISVFFQVTTERKKAEQALLESERELRKHRDELEIRVQERTTELQRATELLERIFSSIGVLIAYMDKDFNFIRVNRAYAESDERTPQFYIGKNHFVLFPNAENETIFRKVVETGEPYFIYQKAFEYAEHPERGITYWDWSLHPVKEADGVVSGVVLTLINVTERKETQKRIQSTNALLNLFSKTSNRKEYLEKGVGLIQEWTGCRCVGIRVVDDRGFLPYESYTGFSREFWESENWLSLDRDVCACVRVVKGDPDPQDVPYLTVAGSFCCNHTTRLVDSLTQEQRARFRGVCIRSGFLSVGIIPIRYRDQPLGAIHLADEREGLLPAQIVEFIESMAPLIGEAMNRFNLEQGLREHEARLRQLSSRLITVQEDERKRIAREIHDGIGQRLSAVKFRIEGVLQQKGKWKEKEKVLEELVQLIRGCIDESRRVQMDLRPSMIDDLGILPTINWFCREFQQTYASIHIEKHLPLEEQDVPDRLKIVLFRLLQEAMNNVAKHSKATRVDLDLRRGDGCVELVLQDNGAGFDLQEVLSRSGLNRGLGLASMRERAELSGGTFTIDSAQGKGTRVRAAWPSGMQPAAIDRYP